MPGPDFDPRGEGNHALLVGVAHYDHADDLPGVRHNVDDLSRTLAGGGLFGPDDITRVSPGTSSEFLTALDRAAEKARGLLLVYFAGHGRLSHDGAEFFLTFRTSRRLEGDEPHYSESVSWNDLLRSKLRGYAASGTIGRIVVILDCCFAGNALESFKPGALQPGRDRISVLTAVQVNRRIPAGHGDTATPYTGHLVRLLRHGVGAEDGLVRLAPLAVALQEALQGSQTDDGDPWEPRHHLAEGRRDVVLGVTQGREEARRPFVVRSATTVRAAARRLGTAIRNALRSRVLIALGTVAAVMLALGGYGLYRWVDDSAACAAPVQLRLLADPDVEPTVGRAVEDFLDSSDNQDGHGCRRAGISIESPQADGTVTGLQHAAQWQDPPSTGRFQPQRDIGAQPDVWIPGSSVSYKRALAARSGAATLDSLGPLAYSPLVLAVLRTFAVPDANATGVPLASLVSQLETNNKQAVVLRADPEYTDTAQLATVGLYGIGGSTDVRVSDVEQQEALLNPVPRSSYDLMCALAAAPASLKDRTAVVVPEQVMAQFNDAKAPLHEPECLTGRLGQRAPEYPSDVGMLDLPFVHVTWHGGDRDAAARTAAVEALHRWLTGADGQKVFTDAGYRGRSETTGAAAPPPAGSWLTGPGRALGQLPPPADAAPPASVEQALKEFHGARGAGQVLYLLDSSTSMGDTVNKVWSGPGRAKDLVAQSLDAFGQGNQYGVWTVSGKGPPYRALVTLGPYASPDGPRRQLAAAQTGGEAHPGDALLDALGELKQDQRAGHPQLIVMLTDDEDDTWITADQLTRIRSAATAQHVPVYWVSLTSGGCTGSSRHLGPAVAAGTGGRCLDPGGNQAAGLREAVTGVGTGDAQ